MTTLGARLRTLRQQVGLSQRSLAQGLVTNSMISQIESDKVQPSTELLERLARRLGVTADQLLPAKFDDQERLTRYKQAQAFLSLSHYEDALPLLLDCLRTPLATWPLVELTSQAALCHAKLGRVTEAMALYEEALRLAIKEQQSEPITRIRHERGRLAYASGDLQVALEEWRHCVRHLAANDASEQARDLLGDVCLGLANAYRRLGAFQESVRYFTEAMQQLRGGRSSMRKLADAKFGLGKLYDKIEQWDVAEAHLRQAHDLYIRLSDRRSALAVNVRLGKLLRLRGRLAESRTFLHALLPLAQELRTCQSEWVARVLCELAETAWRQGAREEAMGWLEAACRLGDLPPPISGRARLLLASFYQERGDWRRALRQGKRALRLLRREGRVELLIEAYQRLTDLYKQLGDYKRASECVALQNELLQQRILQMGWVLR